MQQHLRYRSPNLFLNSDRSQPPNFKLSLSRLIPKQRSLITLILKDRIPTSPNSELLAAALRYRTQPPILNDRSPNIPKQRF
ncbi:MAG: hypothetical protein ACLBM6_11150, partial [Cuspidothrix sp.]